MTSAASLSLLKGATKSKLETELKKPAPAPVTAAVDEAEVTVTVDVDAMDGAALDELVKENDIPTPPEWTGWDDGGKRQWLKEQFDESEEQVEDVAVAGAATMYQPALAEAATNTITLDAETGADLQKTVAENTKTVVNPDPVTGETKQKAPKAGKKVAKAPLEGEVLGKDFLQDTVKEVENLKKEDALGMVDQLSDQTEAASFKLGGVLSRIQMESWYEPFASFRDFIESVHGINYRRAMYYVAIYNALSESGIPWDKVKLVGWSKLKDLATILTKENVDEWVAIALKQNVPTLIETIKAFKNKDHQKALEDQSSKTVTTKSFKLHDGQKQTIEAAIAKAKEQSGTEVDSAALEYIAQDYIGGMTIVQRLKTIGVDAALKALGEAFPEIAINVEIPDNSEQAA